MAGIACFVLYDQPGKVGKWLTDDEKRFLVLRNEFEYGGKNTAGALDGFSWRLARQSLKVSGHPLCLNAGPVPIV